MTAVTSGAWREMSTTRRGAPLLLLVGLAAAVGVRVGIGGPSPGSSLTAGLLFAACLLAMAAAVGGVRPVGGRHVMRWGLLGAAALCVPVVATTHLTRSTVGFPTWAAAVTVVVVAEEVFLRGVLFDAIASVIEPAARGSSVAVLVTAAAFAALHVPLYGWHVVPLDFSVGVLLGALRLASGSWVAPAIAHAIADYVGWFA